MPYMIQGGGIKPIPALLLDTFPSAAFAYSFRKLITGYSGSAVRIRRSSDNAEADIGFSGNSFNLAAAASHIGGGSGFIVTWYDQSGAGLDLTQATAVNQPTYVASGINSLPSASFTPTPIAANAASLARASVTAAQLGATQGTIFSVINQNAANAENLVLQWDGTGAIWLWGTWNDGLYFDFGSGGAGGRVTVAQPGGWDSAKHILEVYRDSSDLQGIVVDGTSVVTGTRTDDLSGTSTLTMGGGNIADSSFFYGQISELIRWGTDIGSSNRTAVRTNLNSRYTVF